MICMRCDDDMLLNERWRCVEDKIACCNWSVRMDREAVLQLGKESQATGRGDMHAYEVVVCNKCDCLMLDAW